MSGNKSYGGTKTEDKRSAEEYRQFLQTVLTNGLTVSAPDVHAFCYCDSRYIGLVQDVFSDCGIENRRVCLWIKNNINITPGVAFNKTYEPCVYGTRGKPYVSTKQAAFHEILNKEV